MIEGLKRFLRKFWGWTFVVFALVGAGTEYDNFQSGKTENRGVGLMLIVIFGGAGWALLRGAKRQPAPRLARAALEPELDVQGCAARLGGRVTITDVASELQLDFAVAKEALARLEKAGACTAETSDGVVYYDFGRTISSASSARLKNRIGGPQ